MSTFVRIVIAPVKSTETLPPSVQFEELAEYVVVIDRGRKVTPATSHPSPLESSDKVMDCSAFLLIDPATVTLNVF